VINVGKLADQRVTNRSSWRVGHAGAHAGLLFKSDTFGLSAGRHAGYGFARPSGRGQALAFLINDFLRGRQVPSTRWCWSVRDTASKTSIAT
jgi:hypothetical protein